MRRNPVLQILFLLLFLPARLIAQPPPLTPAEAKEPKGPQPTAAVGKLLDEWMKQGSMGHFEEALKAADAALAAAKETKDAVGEAVALLDRAKVLTDLNRIPEAIASCRAAAQTAERGENNMGRCRALGRLGLLLLKEKPIEAKKWFQQAIALGRSETKRPVAMAYMLADVGGALYQQGRFDEAEQFAAAALAMREKAAPGSIEVARSFYSLALIARGRGDMAGAEADYKRSLAFAEKAAPESLDVAASLNELGALRADRSDFARAEDYYRRALAINEKMAPDSPGMAVSLNNMGIDSLNRGDLAAAEELFKRSLTLMEKGEPDSLGVALMIDDLGDVAGARGDFAAAEVYHKRSLALLEKVAPNSAELAHSLANLGLSAFNRGDLTSAENYEKRSLAIFENVSPYLPEITYTLSHLSEIAMKQGKFSLAENYTLRALALRERLGADSLMVAESLESLGKLALKQGHLARAESYIKRALALRERLAPNSLGMANLLSDLRDLESKRGNLSAALPLSQRAWTIARQQAASVSGDEARQAFSEGNTHFAAELLSVQIALHQSGAALVTLEQSRAQALQQLIVERRLLSGVSSGAAWDALQAANRRHNQATQALDQAYTARNRAALPLKAAQQAKASAAKRAPLQKALAAADKQVAEATSAETQARVEAESRSADLKRANPRAYPQSLPIAEAMKTLPPDSVFAAFSVGENETSLFLLRPSKAVQTFTLKVTQKELEKEVNALHNLVAVPVSSAAEVADAARTLYATLFPPDARKILLNAKRLIVSPDEALWEAPFAALVTNASGPPQWLGLQRPLTYANSLSLFAQTRSEKPALAPGTAPVALVVGDPLFDRTAAGKLARKEKPVSVASVRGVDTERRYLWESGQPPRPLPGTRDEANQIAALYGAIPLLGADATEAAVRARLADADVVHLATHGVLRQEVPTASGILLTPPETEAASTDNDGALQAWELFGLKMRAEIAILSACETGRGTKKKGEGLIGLTRALQYAGCRSTLTSQWAISDASAAVLMTAFHRNLRSGLTKDAALQRAMQTVAAGDERTAHPYYWAAFVLQGDPDNSNLGIIAHPSAE